MTATAQSLGGNVIDTMTVVAQSRGGVRVLLVDGRDGFADLFAGILHMSGYNARVVYGVARAVRVVQAFRPHFLISDIDVPGMDGFELVAEFGRRLTARHVFRPTCNIYRLSGWRSPSSSGGVHKLMLMEELFQFLDTCKPSEEVKAIEDSGGGLEGAKLAGGCWYSSTSRCDGERDSAVLAGR